MPELPEVEVIKVGLQKRIIGLKIQKIQILSPKSFIGNPDLAEGQIVLNIWRRAKLLGIDLAEGTGYSGQGTVKKVSNLKPETCNLITLLFHLKMSGQLIYEDEKRFIGGHPTGDMMGKMPSSHTRVIFSFAGGSHLYFNDQRRFGWIKVICSVILSEAKDLINLGPEPLEEDFTWEILKQNLLKHKSQPVKAAIMDQSIVSGVGNIYSNEACFNAKLDPRAKLKDLSDQQFKALYAGIIKALQDGIHHGGSTRAHFVDPEGHKGYFLDYAFVYGRDAHPCKICGTEIKKIQLGGRGTYVCEHCQV